MQADSEKLRQAWIKAVQNSIATAFRENGEETTIVSQLNTHHSSTYQRWDSNSGQWCERQTLQATGRW